MLLDDLLDHFRSHTAHIHIGQAKFNRRPAASFWQTAVPGSFFSLQADCQAWSEHLEPVKVGDLKNGGELYQFVRIGKGCLSYIVISGGEAAIIDATRMVDIFVDFAKEKGAVIKHVFDTHLHADHISGGRKIAR